MAELPSSWGLSTKKRGDGKLDIIGRDDLGSEYRVRTTDQLGVTDKDVAEIAAVDRERATARGFVADVIEDSRRRNASRESAFEDELVEAAGPIAHAGFDRRGSTVGYSRRYAMSYDRAFKEN